MSATTRYTLGDEIARGGVGVVVRARDTHLDRDVAVKLLRPESRDRPSLVRRFRDEARLMGHLQHPGVPPVHDLGTLPDGSPFLAMKLIRGRTLAELLADGPAARWALVGVVEQVAQALAYAHAQGVMHRDIKPHNVMVGAFGEAQLMDWGLAKVFAAPPPSAAVSPDDPTAEYTPAPFTDDPSAAGETAAGSVLGTPAYMPPEQARGEPVGTRADVFSLGAVLCELLTGRPPYLGETTTDVKVQATVGYLRPAYDRLDACGADPELVKLARWCLTADPAGRPADAQAVADALAAHRVGVEAKLRAAELAVATARSRRRWAAAAMLALAVGGAAAGWQWRRATVALAGETAEREKVAAALERVRQTRDRMLAAARRQSVQLAVLAGASQNDVDRDNADSVVDDFRKLWADVLADTGPGPEGDRLRADHDQYLGALYQSKFDYAAATTHLRRAVAYWRGLPADRRGGPAELRATADSMLALANSLAADDPTAGLGGAAVLALNQQEIERLLRECVAARRQLVTATGERADRFYLADALAVAADMTSAPAAARQWDDDELAEVSALTAADGQVKDWCALIDCRGRRAKHAADRGDKAAARAEIAAAEAAQRQAVQTFGKVGTHRVGLRLSITTAEVMLAVGDAPRTAAAVATYLTYNPSGYDWLRAAEYLAGCVPLADGPAADGYARRAVECLGRAVELWPSLAPQAFDKPEFAPIRDTPEFRKLRETHAAKPAG